MPSWIAFRTETVNENLHECYLEGLRVTCDYLYCNYSEEFTNMDDATIAMEIHEKQAAD